MNEIPKNIGDCGSLRDSWISILKWMIFFRGHDKEAKTVVKYLD